MARTPTMSDADYQKLVALSQSLGYDVSKIRKVPQDGTTPR
jgi:apolipoprotein D and lipocalin family protein